MPWVLDRVSWLQDWMQTAGCRQLRGNNEGITGTDGVCREGLWQSQVEARRLARPRRAFPIRDPGRAGLPSFAVATAGPARRK